LFLLTDNQLCCFLFSVYHATKIGTPSSTTNSGRQRRRMCWQQRGLHRDKGVDRAIHKEPAIHRHNS
jgi:hypothetical protein